MVISAGSADRDPDAQPASSRVEPRATGQDALGAAPHVWIRVLGEPTVSPPSGDPPAERDRLGQLTELACLLVMRPGISAYDLDAAMWPVSKLDKVVDHAQRRKAKTDRRNQVMSRLRTWLGDTATGERAVATWTPAGGYRLAEGLQSDWDRWQALVGGDPVHASTAHLAQALDLVTGVPFTHPGPSKYAWAEGVQLEMIGRIAEAAEELASRQLHRGDVTAAHATACHGLGVEPGSEGLWRIAIVAAHASNDPATTHDLVAAMLEHLAVLGCGMEPATTELLRTLKGSPARRPAERLGDALGVSPFPPDVSGYGGRMERRRPGRPSLGLHDRLEVKLTEELGLRVRAAAKRRGIPLSTYVRTVLDSSVTFDEGEVFSASA